MFDFNSLPDSKKHLRKVQLGAGNTQSLDYINIDFYDGEHVDIRHDLRLPLPFEDDCIDEFYSHHVLEHFNYPELTRLLLEVRRCLKVGGHLKSRLPDLEWSMRQFLTLPPGPKRDNMLICIYGGNAFGWEPQEAHKHYFGWTKETMSDKLMECGFIVEMMESVDSDSHIPVLDFSARKSGAGTGFYDASRYHVGDSMWGERTVEVPWLLSRVKEGTALDVGAAESCYTMDLFEQGVSHLVMNDIRHIDALQDDERAECLVGDIRKIHPDDTGLFDNVLCISTLEHIALEAYDQPREVPQNWSAYYPQREAFHHMMKFLAPDGQMLVTIPYGKYEDCGWVIVYDEGMINELKHHYNVIEETYYTMTNRHKDTWVECTKARCPKKGMDHYNNGMRANSVVCMVMKNR